MSNDDSEDEMFPIDVGASRQQAPFVYNDPSLLGGVLRAVVESDLNKLKSLVASGKSLNINDNNGNTALHFAVAKNHLDILKYILDQDGILIDNKNEFGETAVSIATLHGNYDAVKMLIDKGADVNCQENDGTTPLHNSVCYPELMQLLLSNGADVNLADSVNNTPLHIAVEKQCIETIYVLLYYDAEVNVLNQYSYNPFMKSLLNNNPQIQEILLDYIDDFNIRCNHWSTLYIALRFQSPFYKEIVNRGAEVDIEALKVCIDCPNIKNFKFVWNNLEKLDIGPNQDILLQLLTLWNSDVLSSYVDIILENSNPSVLEVLVSNAFASNFHYIIHEYFDTLTYDQIANATFLFLQHGMTLTTSVIVVVFKYFGQCELFKHLVYFDYVDEWPRLAITPILIFDLEIDVSTIYQKILSYNVQWEWNLEDLRTFFGYWTYRPILQNAKDFYRVNIINKSYSEDEVFPKIPSLLQLARDQTRKYIIDKFKMKRTSQYYTYINDMDLSVAYKQILKYERKLYDIPIDMFRLDILNYLVKQEDIRINTRDFLGQTPLYLAVKLGFVDAAKILINHNANVNLPDNEDVSPLHRSITIPELAHLLIVHGANVNVKDYSDDTPLHDAVGDKCLETICMLIFYNADGNAVGGNGLTPFMKALITENEEIQEALFDYVDDYNATTLDEYSTLTLALTNDNPYVEQIIARGGEVDVAAFTACVRVPNVDNFKLVWKNLTPEHVEDPDVSLTILYYELDQEEFKQYVDIIIEYSSRLVLEALAAKTKSADYASIVDKCTQDDFLNHEQVTKLTCLLLQHGLSISTDLIVAVFANMGYCELFRILMYIDYVEDWSPFVITSRLIFDINCDIWTRCNELIAKGHDWTNVRRLREDVISSFSYWIHRPLLDVALNQFADAGMFENGDNEFRKYYNLLPKVPSLIEIARDGIRKHIVNRLNVKSTCQYFTLVKSLELPIVYKKILLFERKLYRF